MSVRVKQEVSIAANPRAVPPSGSLGAPPCVPAATLGPQRDNRHKQSDDNGTGHSGTLF